MATSAVFGVDPDPDDIATVAATDSRGLNASPGTVDTTGFAIISGINMFQRLIFTCYMGSLEGSSTTVKANALVARVY